MSRTRRDSHPTRRSRIQLYLFLLPLSSPPGTLPLPSSKYTNPRPRDAEKRRPGRLQLRRHSPGARARPHPSPAATAGPAPGLSLTDPGRCLRRRRRRRRARRQEAWQTLTAQRSIPPGPKLRPLGFLDPCAHSKSRASPSSQLTAAHAAPPTRACATRRASGEGGAESAQSGLPGGRGRPLLVHQHHLHHLHHLHPLSSQLGTSSSPLVPHRFPRFRLPQLLAPTFPLQVLTAQFSGKSF